MVSMTTNLNITPSTTKSIRGRSPYKVVPDRLIQIDGVDYVRCHQHGLIPLLHVCGDTAHDHWCREAAHPNFDPADGDQGLPNHEEISRLSERVRVLADALLRACLYLDGFIWLHDPEASEMDGIKSVAASSLGCKTWEQAMDLARLRDARTKEN